MSVPEAVSYMTEAIGQSEDQLFAKLSTKKYELTLATSAVWVKVLLNVPIVLNEVEVSNEPGPQTVLSVNSGEV